MRPEILAEAIAAVIKDVVTRLKRQLAELRAEVTTLTRHNEELKGVVAAFETRDARHHAAVGELCRTLLDTCQAVQVLEAHRSALRIDMHAGDPRY